MKNRIIYLVLAVFTAAAVFAGCADNSQDTAESTDAINEIIVTDSVETDVIVEDATDEPVDYTEATDEPDYGDEDGLEEGDVADDTLTDSVIGEIAGEYSYNDTVYVGSISEVEYGFIYESMVGTTYSVTDISFTITSGEEVTDFTEITYVKEELTDDFIAQNYDSEDSDLADWFAASQVRYRYSIYDAFGEKVNYYLFEMDGEVFVCHYGDSDSQIYSIDKILR